MVILISIAAFFATFLGGFLALHLKDRLHLILGFSAGAVIGVAFFDLMPEALQLAGSGRGFSFTTSLMALGFALYLVFDRMIILHRHHEDLSHEHAHAVRGVWGAGTLSLHSFLDGVGIGLAFKVSPAIGLVVAAAVLAHDFSDGINTVNMILKNNGTRAKALRWLMIDALAPLVGVLSTLLFTVSEGNLGLLLALFAGFFLYIGASDLLPESHHAHPKRWTTVATVLGMAVIYIIVQLAGV
ncbi:MAG: Zinc/iron permease [Candidatus Kaiserbacteria bacterium GW2011_GWB1_52_6]|uniref:Zinc/iron permease n=3 Tax=Candidatus Kaiseribacteriota TaxID=1752734 RepID=A0A0G1XJW8_9BACT|nr:MAG: Zinc/iron permease [Candidatus Kaiserbacteria bacterium GW2011_GWA2_52_12]KKW28181.1 MAG: Zinc/iron permease [Candidatus Kaiserbacteria bacterium GW2011_GWB1_52_6]KKW31150.1 MAG: Zinc/iron permease [Candidatus Kaiserbacteria bacterium GW2011_GWC2_52_8b]